MNHITETIRIDAPKDKVWSVLADFGGISKFHPGLRSSRSTSAASSGEGATRECELRPMGTIQERIVEWRDGEEMVIEIFQGKNMPPLDFTTTRAHLSARADGEATLVTMAMQFRTKGALGAAMGPMLKAQFGKTVPNILRGLKHYVEQGERATPRQLRQIPMAATPATP